MVLFIDGASRGNPGDAGVGFVLFDEENNKILECAYSIINCTNNIAEYSALLISLYIIKKENITKKLVIKSDSLLLVNQCNKLYKIKNSKISLAYNLFITNFSEMDISFVHVKREFNKNADALANRGINEKIQLSKDISDFISVLF